MRRIVSAALVLGAFSMLAPVAAQADHCNTNVIIFSYVVPATYDPNAGVCTVDEGEDLDGRLIYPGATSLTIRYTQPVADEPEFIFADITGTLVSPRRVKLFRGPGIAGGTFYDSNTILTGGRTASGCITVVVEVPGEDPEDPFNRTTYRTVTATC